MTNTLTKQALTTFTPAVREVIGQPARTYATTQRIQVTKYPPDYVKGGLVAQYGWIVDPDGKRYYGLVGYTWVRSSGTAPYLAYEDVVTYTTVPAVQAVAGRDATLVVDNQLGWTGSARSIAVEGGDLFVEFQIPAGAIGVAAGLVTPAAASPALGSIEHGFLYADGAALQIIEGGVPVHTHSGATTASTVFQVARVGSQVTYLLDDSAIYSSSTPSRGLKSLGAVLYSGGDAVDSPALTAVDPIGVDIGWNWDGEATVNDAAIAVTVPVSLRMEETDYSSMSLVMDLPDISASGGFTQVDASGMVVTIPMTFAMQGIEVDFGQMYETIGMSMVAADYDYGSMQLVLDGPDVLGVEFNDPPNTANAAELLIAADVWHTDPVLYATINESLTVGDTLDMLLTMDALMSEFLGISEETTASAIIYAMLNSSVRFTDNAMSVNNLVQAALDQYVGDTSTQYATNLTTGAVGRYEGFDFGGFCRVGMDTYGWKSDGVYKIGAGEGDNGQLISALIDFAAEQFDTSTRKRLTSVYLGLDTDGQVYVRMTDDRDRDVTYRAKQRGTEYRSDMQQGTSSRFWRMRLELVDATYGDLDNVEWLAGSTARRTTK